MSAPKTVRVRIAVGVAADGRWSCCGSDDCSDAVAMEQATEIYRFVDSEPYPVTATIVGHWITATIPIPEPLEIEADAVEPAEDGQ